MMSALPQLIRVATPPVTWHVGSQAFTEIAEEQVEWLWPGVIPFGKLTLIIGDPGHGKSYLTVDLAARVSAGLPLPDGTPTEVAPVLLVFCEDGASDTVKPRLRVHGANQANVRDVQVHGDGQAERLLRLDLDLDGLAQEIERTGARLVILDPLNAYLGSKVNAWKDDEVRRLLAGVAKLADRTGCAMVAIMHLNKKQVSSALQRATGSGAFAAVARSVFLVGPHSEDVALPLKDQRRVFAPVKMNLGPPVASRVFRIRASEDNIGRFVWEGETSISARDMMVSELGGSATDGKLEQAVEWLKAQLARGAQRANIVHDAAEAAGISRATLRRARGLLDIEKRQEAADGTSFWTWRLPEGRGPGF